MAALTLGFFGINWNNRTLPTRNESAHAIHVVRIIPVGLTCNMLKLYYQKTLMD